MLAPPDGGYGDKGWGDGAFGEAQEEADGGEASVVLGRRETGA